MTPLSSKPMDRFPSASRPRCYSFGNDDGHSNRAACSRNVSSSSGKDMRTSLCPWLTERIEAAARVRTNKERVESLSINSFGQSRWTDQLDIQYEREGVCCTIVVPLGSAG